MFGSSRPLSHLHQPDLDTTTANGKLIFTIFAAVAGFERELLCERTRAGDAVAKARRRIGGRLRKVTPDQVSAAQAVVTGGGTVAPAAAAVGMKPATLHASLKAARAAEPVSA